MENHLKLFPSYDITKLRWLLARSYERERKMMEAIDIFCEDSLVAYFCKACYTVQRTGLVFQCVECGRYGCVESNTENSGVSQCSRCNRCVCEQCDPLVLEELKTELECWVCTECST